MINFEHNNSYYCQLKFKCVFLYVYTGNVKETKID